MTDVSIELDATNRDVLFIGGIKAAFIKHAREDLGLTEPEE